MSKENSLELMSDGLSNNRNTHPLLYMLGMQFSTERTIYLGSINLKISTAMIFVHLIE
jgi:hypothetical protein